MSKNFFRILTGNVYVAFITHDFYQSLEITLNHLNYFKDNIFKHVFRKL